MSPMILAEETRWCDGLRSETRLLLGRRRVQKKAFVTPTDQPQTKQRCVAGRGAEGPAQFMTRC